MTSSGFSIRDVRAARPEDRAVVVGLWRECGLTRPWNDPYADFDRALAGSTSTVLVADLGSGPVGAVVVGDDGHRGWVYYLAVAPDLQRRGIGRDLMGAAEDWLRARGCPALRLMVRSENEQVLGFYAALGYDDRACMVLGRDLAAGAAGPEA